MSVKMQLLPRNEYFLLSVCSWLSKSLPYHLRSSYGIRPLDVNETLFFLLRWSLGRKHKAFGNILLYADPGTT